MHASVCVLVFFGGVSDTEGRLQSASFIMPEKPSEAIACRHLHTLFASRYLCFVTIRNQPHGFLILQTIETKSQVSMGKICLLCRLQKSLHHIHRSEQQMSNSFPLNISLGKPRRFTWSQINRLKRFQSWFFSLDRGWASKADLSPWTRGSPVASSAEYKRAEKRCEAGEASRRGAAPGRTATQQGGGVRKFNFGCHLHTRVDWKKQKKQHWVCRAG